MFNRFYTASDPANPGTDDPAITDDKKTPDPNNTDPDKGKLEDVDKGKSNTNTDITDYKAKFEESDKARQKAEGDFKEFQRGITPKLEKLSEIEKRQQSTIDETDVLVEIDNQIK